MTVNNMHDPLQSTYRAVHSTKSALIKVTGDIDTVLGDDGVLLPLPDLLMVFDTVDYTILLDHLEALLGIKGNATNHRCTTGNCIGPDGVCSSSRLSY